MNISMKCRTCNTTFQDNGSLEIHYQYTHNATTTNNNINNINNNDRCKETLESAATRSSPNKTERCSSSDAAPDVATTSATIPSIVDNSNKNTINSEDRIFKFSSGRQLLSPPPPLSTSQSCTSSTMTAISPGLSSSVHSSPPRQTDESMRNNNNNNFSAGNLAAYSDINHASSTATIGGQHHLYDPTAYVLNSPATHDFSRNFQQQQQQSSDPQHQHYIQQQQQQQHPFGVVNNPSSSNSYIDEQQHHHHQHQRYHPYYKAGFRDPRAGQFHHLATGHHGTLSQMIVSRCDKCDFACASQDVLLQHMHVVHGGVSFMQHYHPAFNHHSPVGSSRFAHHRPGTEPQAEILDLDSHKVHVYQPPTPSNSNNSNNNNSNGSNLQQDSGRPDQQNSDNQRSAFETWVNESDKKYYPLTHHQHSHLHHLQQQQQHNGCTTTTISATTPNAAANSNIEVDETAGGGASLPSPDFGNVSTTTDSIENFRAIGTSTNPHYDQQSSTTMIGLTAAATLPSNQITSSNGNDGGGPRKTGKKSGGKSGGGGSNGSWKSNEARRPKTYNCSACNKWFTSSGHLKRHYNTTLHKNAVKQSGIPDPAGLPISAHHHPQKDTNNASAAITAGGNNSSSVIPSHYSPSASSVRQHMKNSPPTPTESTSSSEATSSPAAMKTNNERPSSSAVYSSSSGNINNNNSNNNNTHSGARTINSEMSPVGSFLHVSPNLMAGPSDIPGGLLHHPHPTFPPLSASSSMGPSQCSTTPPAPELMKSPSPITTAAGQPPVLHSNPSSNYHHIMQFTSGMSPHHHQQAPPSLFQQPSTHHQSTFYPNFQSPHVSTIRPVTMINHFGNHYQQQQQEQEQHQENVKANSIILLQDNNAALPSFSSVVQGGNSWNYSQYFGLDQLLGTLHHHNGDVGGHLAVKYSKYDIVDPITTTTTTSHTGIDENTPPSEICVSLEGDEETMTNVYSPTNEDLLFVRSPLPETKIKRDEYDDYSPAAQTEDLLFDHRSPSNSLVAGGGVMKNKRIYNGSSSTTVFDPVPDTKADIIITDSLKRNEEDSFYDDDDDDDENTTVSSSTSGEGVDSNNRPSSDKTATTTSNSTNKKRITAVRLETPDRFLCHKCDKSFNKSCYLTQHNKSFHSGFKPYKCNRCGKRFNEPEQYKDHTAKHAGDKPHKCELCPKQFNHKTDLRRHVCLHTNNRPHICDVCQKGFIRKDHMMKHRETHANSGRKQIFRQVKIQKIKRELELDVLC